MPDLPRRAGSCAAGGHPTTPSALWALPHVDLLRELYQLSLLPAASPCSTAFGVLRPHHPPPACRVTGAERNAAARKAGL